MRGIGSACGCQFGNISVKVLCKYLAEFQQYLSLVFLGCKLGPFSSIGAVAHRTPANGSLVGQPEILHTHLLFCANSGAFSGYHQAFCEWQQVSH